VRASQPLSMILTRAKYNLVRVGRQKIQKLPARKYLRRKDYSKDAGQTHEHLDPPSLHIIVFQTSRQYIHRLQTKQNSDDHSRKILQFCSHSKSIPRNESTSYITYRITLCPNPRFWPTASPMTSSLFWHD
jgi:predicted nucleic acid binding AN1-type Zn finger protein